MNQVTYAKGTLLWIDDRLEGYEPKPETVWQELFGDLSRRLYRLMDLNFEVATSCDEALQAIEYFSSSEAAGEYVTCVVDLNLPPSTGQTPQIKYGIRVAKELRRRKMPFVFLSANTHATNILTREQLFVPCYHKGTAEGSLRLPRLLAERVLGEFRSQIAWVSLESILSRLDPRSDLSKSFHSSPDAFRYYPFFGVFRDFVEHWELHERYELPRVFVVRACRDDSPEAIQQSLIFLLNESLLIGLGKPLVKYGTSWDEKYLHDIFRTETDDGRASVSIIRTLPEKTDLRRFQDLVANARSRSGWTVIVLPDDESADLYANELEQQNITTVGELPYIRRGDAAGREELIRSSCGLAFQRWSHTIQGSGENPLPLAYICHPELLINPIHWMVFLEAEEVAESLSDPFEIIHELHKSMSSLSEESRKEILEALENEKPVGYESLLRVGEDTLRESAEASELPSWMERALDMWLDNSRHFPHGLGKQFAQLQNHTTDDWLHWAEWANNCYEILVEMFEEYAKQEPAPAHPPTPRQLDLQRAHVFLRTLGGRSFLTRDLQEVDWESLESHRWPHHRYPLPSAVGRRLKDTGRYLWIQPEALDLANVLPAGRAAYHSLASMVDRYWSGLTWAKEVAEKLPRGWSQSVRALVQVVLEHKIADIAKSDEHLGQLWTSLRGLLRNACPVALISDRILRGRPLAEGRGNTRQILRDVKGYGKILGHLRGRSMADRVGGYLRPKWSAESITTDLRLLVQAGRYLESEEFQQQVPELTEGVQSLLQRVSSAVARGSHDSNLTEVLNQTYRQFARDMYGSSAAEVRKTKGPVEWHLGSDKLAGIFEDWPDVHLNSLLGAKADHLWHVLDALAGIRDVSLRYRYFDGYHFLAAVNDLRRGPFKDGLAPVVKQTAKVNLSVVELSVMEKVLELFLAGLEGLVAQLAWVLRAAGHENRANLIEPPHIEIVPPQDAAEVDPNELEQLFRVVEMDDTYAVYTLGLPGNAQNLCFDHQGALIPLTESREAAGAVE